MIKQYFIRTLDTNDGDEAKALAFQYTFVESSLSNRHGHKRREKMKTNAGQEKTTKDGRKEENKPKQKMYNSDMSSFPEFIRYTRHFALIQRNEYQSMIVHISNRGGQSR